MDREKTDHLPVEIFKKAVEQSKRYGTLGIVFTGGEPFMHPQLMDMVDIVVNAGLEYYIVTNGVRIDKLAQLVENEKRRKFLTSISISLDGVTAESNDRIRGKGVFRKVMASTAYLKSKGMPFGYKQSVNTINVSEMDKFVIESAKLGASYIEFSQMHPTPDLVKQGLILPRDQWNNVDQQILRWSKMIKTTINMCTGGYSRFSFLQCLALQMHDIHVDCRGNVCVCCVLPYYTNSKETDPVIAGNLAEMDLWDAHSRLMDIIAGLNKSKIKKIGEGTFSTVDHYSCMYCFKYFGKLDWMKDMDPNNEWISG
jgi:MoaA/NifB/PqqE/SkfB family radical SAM enzyme